MNELVSARPDQPQPGTVRFGGSLRAALRLVLDFALPPLCPSCRDPLGEGIGLCAPCWSKLSFIEPPYCARLGIPFAYDPGAGLLSMEAIANPPAYDRARAAVRYDDVARTLVQAFKYGDRLDLAPMMGQWMARAGRELLEGADALVPVPLHWRRRWARRFNQSAALAGGDLGNLRCAGRACRAQAGARHAAAGGTVEIGSRAKRAGRLWRTGRAQSRYYRPALGVGR
jgi:predicted amidophosphoribosyltransferase